MSSVLNKLSGTLPWCSDSIDNSQLFAGSSSPWPGAAGRKWAANTVTENILQMVLKMEDSATIRATALASTLCTCFKSRVYHLHVTPESSCRCAVVCSSMQASPTRSSAPACSPAPQKKLVLLAGRQGFLQLHPPCSPLKACVFLTPRCCVGFFPCLVYHFCAAQTQRLQGWLHSARHAAPCSLVSACAPRL